MDRRRFVNAVVAGISMAITGCFTNNQSRGTIDRTHSTSPMGETSQEGTSTQPFMSTTPVTSSTSCKQERERLAQGYGSVVTDTLAGFGITKDRRTVPQGEPLQITATNESNERRTTGLPQTKYDIHHQTQEGWDSIFWVNSGGGVFEDAGRLWDPGEEYTWELLMTPDGLAHEVGDGTVRVCEPIVDGTYRFLFWPVRTYPSDDNENVHILGTVFTVTHS